MDEMVSAMTLPRALGLSLSIAISAPVIIAIAATVGYALLPLVAILLVCVGGWR
jgi:hypothetical protein